MSENGVNRPAGPVTIKIVGVGGAGCRALRLLRGDDPAVERVAVDTDWACVRAADACRKVELRGVSVYGLGSGGHPVWAERCAEKCAEELREAIGGAGMLLIVAGLGGGTGSGAGPVIARIANQAGVPVAAVVTLPLDLEGCRRGLIAGEGLEALKKETGAVCALPLERVLQETGGKISLSGFYAAADRMLCDMVLFLMGRGDVMEGEGPPARVFQLFRGGERTADSLPDQLKRRLDALRTAP